MSDGFIYYIISDAETAFGRTRWALVWTPFGPVLILEPLVSELTLPPYK